MEATKYERRFLASEEIDVELSLIFEYISFAIARRHIRHERRYQAHWNKYFYIFDDETARRRRILRMIRMSACRHSFKPPRRDDYYEIERR